MALIKQLANKLPFIFYEKSLLLYTGLSTILIALSVISYFINSTFIYFTIPCSLSILGTIVTLRSYYFSTRDFSFYQSILVGIIAFSSSLVFYLYTKSLTIILPLGLLLMALSLTYYYWREYNFNPKYLLGLSFTIVLSGVGLIITLLQNEPNMMFSSYLVLLIMGLYLYDFMVNK